MDIFSDFLPKLSDRTDRQVSSATNHHTRIRNADESALSHCCNVRMCAL